VRGRGKRVRGRGKRGSEAIGGRSYAGDSGAWKRSCIFVQSGRAHGRLATSSGLELDDLEVWVTVTVPLGY
jgi:hypothetical protein